MTLSLSPPSCGYDINSSLAGIPRGSWRWRWRRRWTGRTASWRWSWRGRTASWSWRGRTARPPRSRKGGTAKCSGCQAWNKSVQSFVAGRKLRRAEKSRGILDLIKKSLFVVHSLSLSLPVNANVATKHQGCILYTAIIVMDNYQYGHPAEQIHLMYTLLSVSSEMCQQWKQT